MLTGLPSFIKFRVVGLQLLPGTLFGRPIRDAYVRGPLLVNVGVPGCSFNVGRLPEVRGEVQVFLAARGEEVPDLAAAHEAEVPLLPPPPHPAARGEVVVFLAARGA
jgi:hypothetical protein